MLLLNLQNYEVFPSHILDRDVWTNPTVQEMINQSYIFMQGARDTELGRLMSNFCKALQANPPSVAIIDPQNEDLVTLLSGDDLALPSVLQALSLFSSVPIPEPDEHEAAVSPARFDSESEESDDDDHGGSDGDDNGQTQQTQTVPPPARPATVLQVVQSDDDDDIDEEHNRTTTNTSFNNSSSAPQSSPFFSTSQNAPNAQHHQPPQPHVITEPANESHQPFGLSDRAVHSAVAPTPSETLCPILLRLPDNVRSKHLFPFSTTIAQLSEYVRNSSLGITKPRFTVSTTRRQLSEDETLESAGLDQTCLIVEQMK
eukprot:c20734_g1_i2.p1 GENE.c20734_g1_i2~~c20734_g1_i2.p1  ORF type:complete len:315 (-),score=54.08 c20734_g1_i2:18-962(-)